jgi:hypothetical protein
MAEKVSTDGASRSSVYAEEGTRAHELAEIRASEEFGKITKRQAALRVRKWRAEGPDMTDEELAEMEAHVASYVALIKAQRALHPHSQVLFEQRVQTGIDRCWGTADAVIVSPEHVEIIDLKYGQGVAVYADNNPQLMLYGVGALESFGDLLGDTETVRVTICQPRLDSVSSFEIPATELRAWRDGIKPVAARALGPDAEFGPSDSACRWCPAAGVCRARMEYMTQRDFGTDPDLITDEEMGQILERIPGIRAWCADVEDAALRHLYSDGGTIPGWKVVISGGKRRICDHDAALAALTAAGFQPEEVARTTLKTLGDLEKLVGKNELPKLLGELLAKGPGSPSVVHETDPRPAASPASEAEQEFRDA